MMKMMMKSISPYAKEELVVMMTTISPRQRPQSSKICPLPK
jgi:hypothetical protein